MIAKMKPYVWHPLTITLNREDNSAMLLFGERQITVEDSLNLETDTPILRWVMEDMDSSVEIRIGNKEEFDILTWFFIILLSHLIELFSKLPIDPVYVMLLVAIFMFIRDFLNDRPNIIQNRLIENEPRIWRRRRRRNN
jgi:hypothetical protein